MIDIKKLGVSVPLNIRCQLALIVIAGDWAGLVNFKGDLIAQYDWSYKPWDDTTGRRKNAFNAND